MRWKDCECIINIPLVITYVNVYHNVQAHPEGNQAVSNPVCVSTDGERGRGGPVQKAKSKLLSVMEVQKKNPTTTLFQVFEVYLRTPLVV